MNPAMDPRTPVLFLAHRIPWPPNKGDKVRSFNILRHLARHHRVFLGCFVDQPEDVQHIGRLDEWCAGVHVVRLDPRLARLASARGLFGGEALSLPYYRSAALRRWVATTVQREGITQAVAFSGPMAQYVDLPELECVVVDFCDVDSAKWTQYAAHRRGPLAWLYRREGERLLAFERAAAQRAGAALFVTEAEAALFRRAAPEAAGRVWVMQNGVDAEFFSPAHALPAPWPAGGPVLVFTGAMDYWPNVDAVCWFAEEVLPALRARHPGLRFYVVGMNPAAAVRDLAGPDVVVTGTVPDVRPYLAHADVVVAPLRVARGIQNKVLEAMAMARAVAVSTDSATGLAGEPGAAYLTAGTADEFVAAVDGLLADPARRVDIGAVARRTVETHYSWTAHLGVLDALLGTPPARAVAAPLPAGAPA